MSGVPDEAVQRLLDAWRGEVEARAVYELIAEREQDPQRADILRRMAAAGPDLRRASRQPRTGNCCPR